MKKQYSFKDDFEIKDHEIDSCFSCVMHGTYNDPDNNYYYAPVGCKILKRLTPASSGWCGDRNYDESFIFKDCPLKDSE